MGIVVTATNISLLNKIDNRIYKLIKDDGILETEDRETIDYKAQSILYLAQQLETGNLLLQEHREKLIALLDNVCKLLALGEPDFESTIKIETLFKKIRAYVKGMKLHLEVNQLDPDDDIPEHVYEAFEPFIDPDSGECEYPTDTEFESNVLWRYQSQGIRPLVAVDVNTDVTALIEKMGDLSLQLNKSFQVDLGGNMTGMANPRMAMQAELSAMREATKFYFEPTHIRNTADIAKAAQAFYLRESTETDLCAGSLIVAACEALRSVHLLKERPVEHEAKLTWQGVPLSLQRKPTHKNAGNLLIRNLGSYGHRLEGKKSKWNVLDDFANVEVYSGTDLLKRVIAKYGSNPGQITCKMLKLPETTKGHDLLKKLQQNLFLIFCAEIFRYFPIEEANVNKVKEIPFAIALSMGLELLYIGEIELADLFDADATLGLPTGTQILDNPASINAKLRALIQKYQNYLQEGYSSVEKFKKQFPNGMVVRTKESHVSRLEESFGNHLKFKRK